MRPRLTLTTLAVAIGWACASSGTNPTTTGATPTTAAASRSPSRSQDVITEAEIASHPSDAANALELVQKLRPQMLRSRGMVSIHDSTGAAAMPRVYVDNVSYGAIDALANITTSQVKEIRYINARDATTQWGTGNTGGVILVTTKK